MSAALPHALLDILEAELENSRDILWKAYETGDGSGSDFLLGQLGGLQIAERKLKELREGLRP